MSSPTFVLPPGYASVNYGGRPNVLTESTTAAGAMIWKSFKYANQPKIDELKGEKGFAAGLVIMKAASAGAGGTKFDGEKITISCLSGEHATKSWPVAGDIITLAGGTGKAAKYNGDWMVVSENDDYARENEADAGYDLQRWCDIDLTP